MTSSKPYVAVACVCEKVLIEPDKVVSLIRIVDTFFLTPFPDPLPTGAKPAVSLTAFISVKAGTVTGTHEVALQLKKPSGKTSPVGKWPVVLNEPHSGANLKIDFVVQDPEMGLYWFDVLWGDEALTSIPFRLQLAEELQAARG